MGKKEKNIILFGVLAIVLVIGAVTGIYFVNRNANGHVYLDKLDAAAKYLSEGDYDNAILTLEELIQKEPDKEELYSKLANVYVKQGNYTKATSVLQLGIDRTGSSSLKNMLQIIGLSKEEETEQISSIVAKEAGEQGVSGLKNQVRLLAVDFREYSDGDYEKKYGLGTSVSVEPDKIVKVNYQNLDADVYYRNTESSNAFHAKNLDVYDTSHPYRIVFRSLDTWIEGLSYPADISTMEEIIGLRPLISDNAEHGTKQLEFTYRFCKCLVACDENGTVSSADTWSEIYLDGRGEEGEGDTFQGQVINAKTGLGVEAAQVTFAAANGKETTATTDAQGYYEISIEAGDFTIAVSAEGFQEEEFDRSIQNLRDSEEGLLTITPAVGEGEVVIVLEWGASPRDLDSILQCDGFQIDFINRQDSNKTVKANLDVDETEGFGPETVTVELSGDADFTYLVNNYSGEADIAGCGATVKVYANGEAPVVYTVPSNGSGRVWEVFKYHNGEITEVNDIYDVQDINRVNK